MRSTFLRQREATVSHLEPRSLNCWRRYCIVLGRVPCALLVLRRKIGLRSSYLLPQCLGEGSNDKSVLLLFSYLVFNKTGVWMGVYSVREPGRITFAACS